MSNQALLTHNIHLVDHEKGSIHLVDGEKGGIGKSTFCRLLIEYLQDEMKIDPTEMEIIDADKEQPLIGRTYAPNHYLKETETDTLKKSYLLYEERLHHIIVKNKGLASTERDWWAFDRDEDLKMYLELYKETTSMIEMAQLLVGTSNYEAFKKRNLPIRDVANLPKAKELGFLITQSARFKKWRDLCFESLKTLPWKQVLDQSSENLNESSINDVALP